MVVRQRLVRHDGRFWGGQLRERLLMIQLGLSETKRTTGDDGIAWDVERSWWGARREEVSRWGEGEDRDRIVVIE